MTEERLSIMNNAEKLFTSTSRNYNCAQAVACGCGREDLYDELAGCGGGRAPEGRCGALHAALEIVPEEQRKSVTDAFRDSLGAVTCNDLKRVHHVPCAKCVAIGAKLAELHQK